MLYLSGKVRKLDLISVCFIIAAIVISISIIRSYYGDQIRHLKSETYMYKKTLDRLKVKISLPRYPFATNYERKDYHDHDRIESEMERVGPGEHGKAYELADYLENDGNRELFKKFGFFVGASDDISVNRSLPDVRLSSCKTKQQLINLPQVSIVIVYFDEYWSILLRTLHSIYNRTPHELLFEIVLINDNSTLPELYKPLEDYVKGNFNGLVNVFTMTEHMGLALARIEGAKKAKGEVIVFLDAQIEVNVNWLPPLLEPIALTPKLITHPIIDNIAFDTFEYRKTDDGGRGIFNWNLQYRRFPRRPEDRVKMDEPIPSPIMTGTAFVVNRQNFWDLGALDVGMKVYQGEQLDFSLKAHLCGIGMVEVPCSRVGHSFRSRNYYKRIGDDGQNYMAKNLKRIVEVWLDEFKDAVYLKNRAVFEADAGDLTRPKSIKRGLHCKPFRYFIEFVAPEMLERYPIEDPGCFAQGTIQSRSNPNLCIEVPKTPGNQKQVVASECDKSLVQPSPKQFFKLAWHRNLQHFTYDFCLQNNLAMQECHFAGGNQFWRYDLTTSQLSQPSLNYSRCISLDNNHLNLKPCDPNDVNQKWNWGEKNISALNDWENFGVDLNKLELST